MSSKDSDEIGSMHTTGNNIEIIKVMKPMSSLKKNWFSFLKISKRIRRINERKWVCFW